MLDLCDTLYLTHLSMTQGCVMTLTQGELLTMIQGCVMTQGQLLSTGMTQGCVMILSKEISQIFNLPILA